MQKLEAVSFFKKGTGKFTFTRKISCRYYQALSDPDVKRFHSPHFPSLFSPLPLIFAYILFLSFKLTPKVHCIFKSLLVLCVKLVKIRILGLPALPMGNMFLRIWYIGALLVRIVAAIERRSEAAVHIRSDASLSKGLFALVIQI